MAVVKMHKASDGSLHESFEAYAKHEAGIKIAKALEELGLSTSETGVIVENADALRNILNASVVSRRGRKGQ